MIYWTRVQAGILRRRNRSLFKALAIFLMMGFSLPIVIVVILGYDVVVRARNFKSSAHCPTVDLRYLATISYFNHSMIFCILR